MVITTLDVRTLIGVLFWSNLTSLALVYVYIYTHAPLASEKKLTGGILLAKACFTLSFLLLSLRGHIPEGVAVNLGNSLMIAGCFSEAVSLLRLVHENTSANVRLLAVIAIVSLVFLNTSKYLWQNQAMFISIGLFSIFSILIFPSWKLLFSKNTTQFKHIVGVVYITFTALLLPGAFYIPFHPENGFYSNTLLQTISYTAIVLLVVFSLSAFLLLMKEDSDRKMRRMAQSDSLTGLNNRQHFFSLATPAFERHKREQTPCSVIFMDIDHFKKINDTYGHTFGDEVIVATASILQNSVRGYDLPCRYGGEEFAAFIDSSDTSIGRVTAERIRRSVEEKRFSNYPDFKFTISLGVATCVPKDDDSIDNFIIVADEALYDAKASGRNKVAERIVKQTINQG